MNTQTEKIDPAFVVTYAKVVIEEDELRAKEFVLIMEFDHKGEPGACIFRIEEREVVQSRAVGLDLIEYTFNFMVETVKQQLSRLDD